MDSTCPCFLDVQGFLTSSSLIHPPAAHTPCSLFSPFNWDGTPWMPLTHTCSQPSYCTAYTTVSMGIESYISSILSICRVSRDHVCEQVQERVRSHADTLMQMINAAHTILMDNMERARLDRALNTPAREPTGTKRASCP